jgi:hypothetical protein
LRKERTAGAAAHRQEQQKVIASRTLGAGPEAQERRKNELGALISREAAENICRHAPPNLTEIFAGRSLAASWRARFQGRTYDDNMTGCVAALQLPRPWLWMFRHHLRARYRWHRHRRSPLESSWREPP